MTFTTTCFVQTQYGQLLYGWDSDGQCWSVQIDAAGDPTGKWESDSKLDHPDLNSVKQAPYGSFDDTFNDEDIPY